jgi:phospholipid/cholesterol/gamma-HCH transport system substrate-binding protein
MAKRNLVLAAVIVGVLALVGVTTLLTTTSGYQLKLVVPSAAQLVKGSYVRIKGDDVGNILNLTEQDGRAVVTVSVDSDHAPLHEGTTAKVDWQSVLGERYINIEPGPTSNAAIPSGAMYEAQSSQVEVDQALAALDAPTRAHLDSLIEGLRQTTGGREQDIQRTLNAAGPSVQALGEILSGVGRDGPAIKTLVGELHQMVGGLASRQDQLSGTVSNLTAFTGRVATNSENLAAGLREVPSTLDSARATLDKIPSTTDKVIPMLHDLRPAAERLPSVADNLRPVLKDLRPVSRDLRPTLRGLADLLRYTPRLMDQGHDTFPKLGKTLDRLGPATEFLRPYTPEFIGFLSNFGSAFSDFDSQGHFWSITPVLGASNLHDLPGSIPPIHQANAPAPGGSVGQPWTDANGDGVR